MRGTFRTVIMLSSLLVAVLILNSCISQDNIISYDELKALLDDNGAMENTTIVDVRAQSEWTEGFIPNAVNIEYETFIDQLGMMKGRGEALTSIVTSKENTIVIYGSGADNARLFASKAIQLGYNDVKYYAGGMTDWREVHGDYLWLLYEGFRQWYEAQCPFDNGENYLVDVHPVLFYTGGHIPGAINITGRFFVPWFPDDVQELTAVINNKEAAIVFYCVGAT
jgi:rhodanese-related sulfurtransferase